MPLPCPTCTGTASPHLGELARLDALVAELRAERDAQSEALLEVEADLAHERGRGDLLVRGGEIIIAERDAQVATIAELRHALAAQSEALVRVTGERDAAVDDRETLLNGKGVVHLIRWRCEWCDAVHVVSSFAEGAAQAKTHSQECKSSPVVAERDKLRIAAEHFAECIYYDGRQWQFQQDATDDELRAAHEALR